jgi:hypothetical protein
MKKSVRLAALIFAVLGTTAAAQEDQHANIRQGLNKLMPLIGTWNATWRFHRTDGVTEELGIHSISFVLDDTYLQWKIERHRKENPERSRSSLIYTTFNPRSNEYEQTYFYSGSALRVTETGEYDDAKHQFKTTAFVPLEDGVHDENVRTITDLSDRNRVVYTHYSRYTNEPAERMDLEIILERVR